jgi:hypothetical protein
MNEDQQNELLLKIIPYSAKLPKRYGPDDRFKPELDSFYRIEVRKYCMQHYHVSENGYHYFMINRIAPSIHEKKIAIAGRFRKDAAGKISAYEEAFWTYKMKAQDLKEKGKILFSDYVEGKDIMIYMSDKKRQEEWIEFPDANCYFDKKDQCWKITGADKISRN